MTTAAIKEVVLFTNRNIMVFDELGHPMPEWQSCVTGYEIDKERALELCEQAKFFFLMKWSNHCRIEVSQLEMEYMLGLRTREMDGLDEEPTA